MIIIGYAILLGILLFVLDRYLDMRVVSYTADAQRHATNLLNLILNSGITKEKLIIDESKFRDYYESDWYSYLMSDRNRKEWEENYEIVEYDYNFSVKEFGAEKHEFGNLIFNMDDSCYFDYQRIRGYAEMPVSVYYKSGDVYNPGIANLTLMKTPLSELSFWISQSALRLEKGYDEEVLKSIRTGPEVTSIAFKKETDNTNIICMSINNKWACKQFYPGSSNVRICNSNELISDKYAAESPSDCEDLSVGVKQYNLMTDCKAININATNNGIDVIIPTRGPSQITPEYLPPDKDAWTENQEYVYYDCWEASSPQLKPDVDPNTGLDKNLNSFYGEQYIPGTPEIKFDFKCANEVYSDFSVTDQLIKISDEDKMYFWFKSSDSGQFKLYFYGENEAVMYCDLGFYDGGNVWKSYTVDFNPASETTNCFWLKEEQPVRYVGFNLQTESGGMSGNIDSLYFCKNC